MKYPEEQKYLIKQNHRKSGFLLAEVLIAIAIMSIAIAVIARSFTQSLYVSKTSKNRITAMELLKDSMNSIMLSEKLEEGSENISLPYHGENFNCEISIKVESTWSASQSDEDTSEEDDSDSFLDSMTFGGTEESQDLELEQEHDCILYRIDAVISWPERSKKTSLAMTSFVEKCKTLDDSEETETEERTAFE